jgi:hypothetical protein
MVYAFSIVLFGTIGAVALKVALRSRWQLQSMEPAPVAEATASAPTATAAAAVTGEPIGASKP